jgi:hypothetical protein
VGRLGACFRPGVRIWLDDMREAPPGWTRCLRPDEVIELLEGGEVEELSLDYDLGLVDERGVDWNGEDVLRWIELQVVEQGDGFRLPVVRIHSANPVGRQRLQRALESIHRRAAGSDGI